MNDMSIEVFFKDAQLKELKEYFCSLKQVAFISKFKALRTVKKYMYSTDLI